MKKFSTLLMIALVLSSLSGCAGRRARRRAAREARLAAQAQQQLPPGYAQQGPADYSPQDPPPPPPPPLMEQTAPERATGPMLSPGQTAVTTGLRRRVAVVNFEDVAQYQGYSGNRRALAAAAADVVTESLHNSGAFIVIEREQLNRVLGEQQLGASGLINPKSAAKMGQLLGVQAIITGKITDLNVIHSKSGFGGYFQKDSMKYHARVSLRMVDVTTGETWAAESGEGEAIQSSAVILGGGKATQDDTLGKKALYAAIHSMMNKLVASAANKPWSGSVASVARGKVYITAGSESGMQVGSTLVVRRLGPEIIDPTTGQVLGREAGDDVGVLQVVGHLNGKVTTCAVVQGTRFVTGDQVTLQ